MPKIIIEMFPGRTIEQKRLLVERITDIVEETINSPRKYINIVIHENPPENVAVEGKLFYDMK